jgi:predicted ArsR family transcriptional regulator
MAGFPDPWRRNLLARLARVDAQEHLDDALDSLIALGDRVRRRVYRFVCGAREPVSREVVATTLGISRSLAAYHLDKLAAHDLLVASYARPAGCRGGPGAGRTAKLYAPASAEIALSLPHRDYALAARLLAEAVAVDALGSTRRALLTAAERCGAELGHDIEAAGEATSGELLERTLLERGYQPFRDADGTLRLANCPFRDVARTLPELICEMNLSLLRALLRALGQPASRARLIPPSDGVCCVAIQTGAGSTA